MSNVQNLTPLLCAERSLRIDAAISLAPKYLFECTFAVPEGACVRDAQHKIWTLLQADQEALQTWQTAACQLGPAGSDPVMRSHRQPQLHGQDTPIHRILREGVKEDVHALASEDVFIQTYRWGIWGRQQEPSFVLSDGDRVEAYRALTVDPKVARRERFAKQGARGAGLFATRRKNSKPGY